MGSRAGSADHCRPGRCDADLGNTYYQHWLAALEALVAAKGAASAAALQRHASAWAQAAGRTPHGQPIHLKPADFPA